MTLLYLVLELVNSIGNFGSTLRIFLNGLVRLGFYLNSVWRVEDGSDINCDFSLNALARH
jgi:hypothetical protein